MLTPDQYAQIAKGYDDAAADPLVPEHQRQEFAKRAEWFHYLAARDPEAHGKRTSPDVPAQNPSRSPRKSFAPFLTTLWLAGAGLYLIGTLLFTNAIGVFDNDHSRRVEEVTLPIESERQTARVAQEAKATVPTAERRHAISPDQPSYEAPELIPPATQEENVASETVREASPSPSTEPEMFQVTKATTIKNGPSANAKVIGTATPGAQLRVRRHENGWIEFIDPSSGNTGWIESDLVAEATGSTDVVSTTSEAENPPPKRSVEKVVKQKTPPPKTAQQRPKPERSYADLPDDEDFIQDRGSRRMGLFARRRMLREGLMSPGFLPPP